MIQKRDAKRVGGAALCSNLRRISRPAVVYHGQIVSSEVWLEAMAFLEMPRKPETPAL